MSGGGREVREISGGRDGDFRREGKKEEKVWKEGGGEKGVDPGKKHRIFLIFEGAQERSTRYFGILGGGGREGKVMEPKGGRRPPKKNINA